MTFTQGSVHVYTYKAGILSPMAHDLRLRLERWEVEQNGSQVIAKFWPESLVVEGPMIRGEVRLEGLSDRDKASILTTVRTEILLIARWPEVTFSGEVSPTSVAGELTIRGVTQALRAPLRRDGNQTIGDVEIAPSRWGIAPYKALGGAIRLQDRVRVVFRLAGGWQ